jgi:hypothetical protein
MFSDLSRQCFADDVVLLPDAWLAWIDLANWRGLDQAIDLARSVER